MWALDDFRHLLVGCEIINDDPSKKITDFRPIFEAGETSLVWVGTERKNSQELFDCAVSAVILAAREIDVSHAPPGRTIIRCDNPKKLYSEIINFLRPQRPPVGIHPMAWIDPEARIGPDCYIGPFTYVGKAEIGAGCTIYPNVYIHDGVRIGSNVEIQAGAIIGTSGFGVSRGADGKIVPFPHIGTVVIGDNVRISANTCVDRGSLSDTVIGSGTYVDNLVHVGHNARLGEDSLITAHAMIGAIVTGKRVFVHPNSTVPSTRTLGEEAQVGAGAVVMADVPDREVWIGNPAEEIGLFKALRRRLRALLTS